MRHSVPVTTAALAVVLVSASVLMAHPHHVPHTHPPVPVNGLEAGLFHPLTGMDHLLAMVTVGILAAVAGGRAIWLVPTAFLGGLVLGGVIGMTGTTFWAGEAAIALSVILLGAAVAFGRAPPQSLALLACGLFGFVHGHAHGREMPELAQPALYAAGFVVATAALHLSGILLGRGLIQLETKRWLVRTAGAMVAMAGVILFIQW